METKIEGLVISKTPYRDRDIVSHILLRSGRQMSVLFFGGRGGGKNQKSSLIEIGHLLSIELRRHTGTPDSMKIAQEWSSQWAHERIRLDYTAFQLLCAEVELIGKVAPATDSPNEDGDEHVGLFRVLSNGLFHLDQSLIHGPCRPIPHALMFLAKLILESGIAPDLAGCIVCGGPLDPSSTLLLERGGMACGSCSSGRGDGAWPVFNKAWTEKFTAWEQMPEEAALLNLLFRYYLQHMDLNPSQLKARFAF